MNEERSGLERLVGRVRSGLERGRSSLARKAAPKGASWISPRTVPTRQRPYLEPLEPRILLSADVGLVPDALLAPPADDFDPRLILEPEIHDELLVREPSKFETIAREAFVDSRDAVAKESLVEPVQSDATEAKVSEGSAQDAPPRTEDSESETESRAGPEDPDAAARALQTRVWQADLADQLSQSTRPDQVIVVDARIPEVDSLLEALLEGVGGSVEDATAGVSSDASTLDPAAEDATGEGTVGSITGAQQLAALIADGSIFDHAGDASATRAEMLANALEAKGVAVVVLDAGRDGLEQLSEIARAYQGVGAMHVVSHGARGSLTLGNSKVTTETLRARAGLLAGLRDSLGEDGDLLLYGCDVADGEVGIEFVSTLAELGGVDVAASTDLTGASAEGGDWDLEFSTGAIEAAGIRAAGFDAVLAEFTLTDPAEAADVTLSFVAGTGMDPGQWVLTSADAFTATGATLGADGEITFTDPDDSVITIVTGDEDDSLTIESVDDAVDRTISLRSGEGQDTLTVAASASVLQGSIELLAGDDADTFVIQGLDSLFVGDLSLRGEAGDDLYDLSALAGESDLGFIEVVETTTGGNDTLRYGGRVTEPPRIVETAGDTQTNSSVVEETELSDPTAIVLSTDEIDSIITSLNDLIDQADTLTSNGDFALGLAGVRGNVDVSVGGALDLGEAFEQLIIEIEANRSGLTAEGLQSLLADFGKPGIEHLDRTLTGSVVGQLVDLAASELFGLELTLDDEQTFSFGLAATVDATGFALGVEWSPNASDFNLTFRREPNGDATLRRSAGSWSGDGFRAGQTLRLAAGLATTASNTTEATEFEIESISGDGFLLTLKEPDDEGASFGRFLDASADNPDLRLLESAPASDAFSFEADQIAVANHIYSGGDDLRENGFREGQTIQIAIVETAGGTPQTTTHKITGISEDGAVLTVEDADLPMSPAMLESITITGKPIAATGSANTNHADRSLASLVDALNEAIKSSNLSGRVAAIVVDADSAGNATSTSRLGFRVLDTDVDQLDLVWSVSSPIDRIGFQEVGASPDLDDLSGQLSGLGELDVRVTGTRYRVATFLPEITSAGQTITVTQSGGGSEVFGGGASPSLTFNASENGRGTLKRSDGSFGAAEYAVDSFIEIAGDHTNDDGRFKIISGSESDTLVLERALSIADASGATPTIARTSGSWIEEGFARGQMIQVASGVEIELTEVSDTTLSLGDGSSLADGDLVGAVAVADKVRLEYDAIENNLRLDFGYEGERANSFKIDLGSVAEEKGLQFGADVTVDLEASFESKLSLVIDLDGGSQTSVTATDLSVSADVNTPEVAIDDLPMGSMNADLATAIFDRNLETGKASNIGFIGAEIGDNDPSAAAGLGMPDAGFVALRADLALSGGSDAFADTAIYESDGFFAADIPITVSEGLPGFSGPEGLGVSTIVENAGDLVDVFAGRDALVEMQATIDTDGDLDVDEDDKLSPFRNFASVETFANLDARGFVRLLGEIRNTLQGINQSEQVSRFDVPFLRDGLSAITGFADSFGDLLLFDDGDDGLDRDNEKVLQTDLNKALRDAGLDGLVAFRVVDRTFGVNSDAGQTLQLVAIDSTVTAISVTDGDFGVTSFVSEPLADDGVVTVVGTTALENTNGRLPESVTELVGTITVARGTLSSSTERVTLARGETTDNERAKSNDEEKLLDADNAPTFATAQELATKLIELAIDGIGVGDNLSYDEDNQLLLFKLEKSIELFATDFSVDFDLDLGPLGSIETVDDPRLSIGGELGFSIEFGIDLSSTPNGQAGIGDATDLVDLRSIQEIGDLVKTDPAITARFGDGTTMVNEPGDAAPLAFEIDRVRMTGAPDLSFGSGDVTRVAANNFVGDLVYLVAPDGFLTKIRQDLGGGDIRITDGTLQQQALVVPRTADGADEVTFQIAVYERTSPLTEPDDAGTDPEWVTVTVDAQSFTGSAAGKREYRSIVEQAIAAAQAEDVSNTITRLDSRAWAADGFAEGQVIELTRSGTNDGRYRIDEISDDGLTLTVSGSLSEEDRVSNVQIEGPGLVRYDTADVPVGSDLEAALAELAPGERLQIVASARNDGTYLITSKREDAVSGKTEIILGDELDPEASSDEIMLVGSGGLLRLDPEGPMGSTDGRDAAFRVQIGSDQYGVEILAEQDPDDLGAPYTADNRSPNDLVQDLRAALASATRLDASGAPITDADGEEVTEDLTQEPGEDESGTWLEVGLDGARLVITNRSKGAATASDFSLTNLNAAARSLGFGGSQGTETEQASTRDDLRIVMSDGEEFLVAFDDLVANAPDPDEITVSELLTVIRAAISDQGNRADDRLTVRIADDGTGLELIEKGQLSGTPRLTFLEADAGTSTPARIVRSSGSWADDGFAANGEITISETERNDGDFTIAGTGAISADEKTLFLATGASIVSEDFVRGATIVLDGYSRGSRDFRVELINGSVAAAALGILRVDAESDANQDGVVDQGDADGLIEGVAIGGSSLLDRIFIKDPELRATLEFGNANPDNEVATPPIEIVGRFGFFEANLDVTAEFVADGTITLNDPTPGEDGDPDLITLRDFAKGFREITSFIDTPKFVGNAAELDELGQRIVFSNDGEDGVITRSVGSWATITNPMTMEESGDGFRVGQMVTIRNARFSDTSTLPIGDFTIKEIRTNSTTMHSELVLEESFSETGTYTAPTGGDGLEIIGEMGAVEFSLTEIATDFVSFANLDDPDGLDANLRLVLFDFGDPFFRKSLGAETDEGGQVTLTALDQLTIVVSDANSEDPDAITDDLAEVETALAEEDEVKVRVVYLDADGKEQSETRVVESYDSVSMVLTLAEDLVDELEDVQQTDGARVVEKITFTKPPKTEIQTPDLGNLLDFSDINLRDIVRGLQLASDFLVQFEAFSFLDAKIPVIELSLNDILDYAEQLAVAVEEIQSDPDGTLQTIELRLEEILGIDPEGPFDIDLDLVTETLEARAGVEEATKSVLKISLILGDDFEESIGIDFNLGGDDGGGVLAGSAGLAASGSGSIRIDLGLDISQNEMRGGPGLVFGTDTSGESERRTITRGDGAFWLADGFMLGQTVKLENAGTRDGRYKIDAINGDTLVLDGEVGADWAGSVAANADDPVEVIGTRAVSLFNSTGISATFDAMAEDVDFRAGAGPLGIFIQDGSIKVGGTLGLADGTSPEYLGGDTSEKIFDAGLAGEDDDRQLATALLSGSQSLKDAFEITVASGIDVSLPVYFPTDSFLQGTLGYKATLSLPNALDTIEFIFDTESAGLGLTIQKADGSFVVGDTIGQKFGNFFGLDQFDPGELSLFDNVRLAVDGFDLLLGGVQDVLDGEVFGIELPLIGDSLADGARFIEDLREDFVEPFRDGIDDAESFLDDVADPNRNVISELLFDLLEGTGLLLVTHAQDGTELSDDQIFTARKSQLVGEIAEETRTSNYDGIAIEERVFMLSQVVRLSGTKRDTEGDEQGEYFDSRVAANQDREGEIDLAGIPTNQIRDIAFIEWDFRLGQDLAAVDKDIALDFGIPAIGLEADGALGIEIGWDLELGFGLDFKEGFYFDIGSADELEVTVDVVLPDRLTGRLAFLQLTADNVGSELGASFVVDLINKDDLDLANQDDRDTRLSFTELGKLRLEAGIAATARADLELELKLNEELLADFANIFPTIVADFEFEWSLGDRSMDDYVSIRDIDGSALSEGLQVVEFTDVSLDLGSFVSDFIKPVLSEIQKVTGPIQPIVDILTSPLPVISDVGPTVTLLDLARATGKLNPALIEAVADIITLVNSIPTNVETVMIPFGDFVIYRKMEDGTSMGVDPTDKNADLGRLSKEQGDKPAPAIPGSGETKGFVDKLKNTKGFRFPILDDPTQIFGLLTGEEVVLFGYDMPPLELDFKYTQFFPIYGPLGLGITGTAAARIDFAFGFDSSGLERFFDSGFTNPVLIFDGFFVSDNPEDVTGAGPDLNELEFDLGFFLSAELNLGIARAGVAGGIEAGIDFDLFDPDRDGKIRVGEILENIENEFLFGSPILAPLAIFDVGGIVTARAFAFLEINLLFFSIDVGFDITPTIKLADFAVDFTRAPKLGTVLEDGMLQLNMGDFAGERLNGDLRDTAEHFRVESNGNDIKVTWVGSNSGGTEFYNVFDAREITGVLAIAGEGDDVVDVSGVTRAGMRYELDGGSGNDRIIAGRVGATTSSDRRALIRGGDGADEIVGSDGDDLIIGGAGSDRILGSAGDDVIFGDLEQLIEKQPRVRNVDLEFVGSGVEVEVRNLDPESNFFVEGFEAGQTVVLERTAEGAMEPDFESAYVVSRVIPGSPGGAPYRLFIASASAPGVDVVVLPTVAAGDTFELAAIESDFLAAYKSSATGSDGSDTIVAGEGSDWVFGGGGDDVLIGGADRDEVAAGSASDLDGVFESLSTYLGGGMIPADNATRDESGEDLLIGDGGEIRLFRSGETRIREVAATNRGLAFGDDRIFGSGGDDTLYGGRGNDEIRGGAQNDTIYGETGLDRLFGDQDVDTVWGGRDDDRIEGGSEGDFLYGEQGADTIFGDEAPDPALIDLDAVGNFLQAGDGRDLIRGGAGSDLLFGGGNLDDVAGGADLDRIWGGGSRDLLRGDAGDDEVHGGTGQDEITIRAGSDVVTGDADNDTFIVNFKGSENSARITVDGGDGIDDLIVNGTGRDDQFLLRAAADRVNGKTFVASINEGNDVERVDYQNFESLIVNGRAGDDRYALDDVTAVATLNGGAGDDFFQVGQLYRSLRTTAAANVAPEDQFETVEVTRGFLSNGISQDTTINAGNDNDTIVVYRNAATLTVNGQAGDDSIEVRAFALVNAVDKLQKTTKIVGGGGADTIRYAVNAPVNIDGGDGLDSVSVIGTEFGDEFVITRDGVFGAGLNVNFVNVEFLRVDGAEGDDRFYIQSTNEDVLTQVVGGLGSDTFQVADGQQRQVISNDLLGHSGLILHDVESEDSFYQGPELDGIRAPGVSVNVADADEPGIVIRQSDGFSRVIEGGVLDWYTVVLTRRPNSDVRIVVNAPELSPEAAAQGEDLLRVWGADPATGDVIIVPPTSENPNSGQSLELEFTSENWFTPQRIWVQGADDGAVEGERFGVIQHKVEGPFFDSQDPDAPAPAIVAIDGPTITDGIVETDDDGDIVTIVDLAGLVDLGEDTLRGRRFEVTAPPIDSTSPPSREQSGGVGQSLLIKSSEQVGQGTNAFTRLTLFGVFDPEDPAKVGSEWRADAWDGLVAPTVKVQIDDDDAPDVTITPLVDGRSAEELQTFESTDPNAGAIEDNALYRIDLGRAPRSDVSGTATVTVRLDVTVANFEDPQVELAPFDPNDPSAAVTWSRTLDVVFTDGETPRFIQVRARDGASPGTSSDLPEGFHRGLIQHTVLSDPLGTVRDVDEYVRVPDERIDLPEDVDEAESLLLANTPLQFRGDVDPSEGSVTENTLTGLSGVEFSIADLDAVLQQYGVPYAELSLRVTAGTGEGQVRTVDGISGQTVTVSEAWDTRPDDTSRFSISGIRISLFESNGDLIENVPPANFDLNGNEIVFFTDDLIVEPRVFDYAVIDYAYVDPGYEGRVEERLPIRIADADSAGVLILESGGSTDVIEVGEVGTQEPGVPPTRPEGADDSYRVVLSRRPTSDVTVTVSPAPTETSRGEIENAPQLQVLIRREGAADFGEAPIQLAFDRDNWNVPQTIEVRARVDDPGAEIDGGDTKVFAPYLRTLSEIQGPLLVDGAGGQGSLEGLAPPVMLPVAEDAEPRRGFASGATLQTITVVEADLQTLFGGSSFDARDLLGRTIAERSGTAVGSERTILEVTRAGSDIILEVDADWDTADLATIDGFEVAPEGETNFKRPTGSVRSLVVDSTGSEPRTFLTVRDAEIDAFLAGVAIESLIGDTIEIVRGADLEVVLDPNTSVVVPGAGVDQFREIIGIEADGDNYRIELAPAFDIAIPQDLPEGVDREELLDAIDYDEYLSGFIAYRITNQSLNFFVNEAESQDVVFVHDEDSPADSRGEMIALDFDAFPEMEGLYNPDLEPGDEGYIVPNRLVGFGMGGDTTIARGLRPGGITYSNFEGFELDLGYGDNTLLVDTVHDRDDDVETYTRVRTGRGDDTVYVSLQNEANAEGNLPWVEIDVGEGDDTINASNFDPARFAPTTVDLNLVGGFGVDTIRGGAGNDLIHGDFGTLDFVLTDPTSFDEIALEAVLEDRTPIEQLSVESTRIGEGDYDILDGGAGDDRVFGGVGGALVDQVRGGAGQDFLFGDYGKVSRTSQTRTVVETTSIFLGDDDLIDGGAGNDLIFGGAGGDALFGTFEDDLIVGEYARVILESGVGASIVRLGQGNLDLAASAFFGLYDPRFGPFADFIMPEQRAARAAQSERPEVRPDGALSDAYARRISSGGSIAAVPYEVEEGDTLWDIAGRELNDPYRWTEIHNLSRDTVADPDLIEPDEQLRIPGQRAATVEQLEADRLAVAQMRARLAEIDAASAEEANAGWGFFNPLAVGAGPPAESESQPEPRPADDAQGEAAPVPPVVEPKMDGEGASLLDDSVEGEAGDDLLSSAAIWSSLVGWRATSTPVAARSRDKWLRFDERAGRFA